MEGISIDIPHLEMPTPTDSFVITYRAKYSENHTSIVFADDSLSRPLLADGLVVDTTLLQARIIGNTLAGLTYGISVLMYIICLKHLRKRNPSFTTVRRKWALYAYTTGMIGLSTAAFLQNTVFTTTSATLIERQQHRFSDALTGYGDGLPLLFSIWGADGLMVRERKKIPNAGRMQPILTIPMQLFRTFVLYRGIPSKLRNPLFCLLAVLLLASFCKFHYLVRDRLVNIGIEASGILFFIASQRLVTLYSRVENNDSIFTIMNLLTAHDPHISLYVNTAIFLIATTFTINVVLVSLIVLRLYHHQKFIEKTLGIKHGSPYRRVMAICVESCALMITTILLTTVVYLSSGLVHSIIPLLMLPQNCVG